MRPPQKASRGFQWVDELEIVHKLTHVLSLLFQLMPLTFPDLDDIVTFIPQELKFLLGTSIHVFGTTVFQTSVGFSAVRKAFGATVPEAALEFVHCVGLHVVPIDGVAAIGDAVLALVACMLNANPHSLDTLAV